MAGLGNHLHAWGWQGLGSPPFGHGDMAKLGTLGWGLAGMGEPQNAHGLTGLGIPVPPWGPQCGHGAGRFGTAGWYWQAGDPGKDERTRNLRMASEILM